MTRLIDADALEIDASIKFYTTPYYLHILDLIDNAPTVEINTNDIEYKAYCKGIEDGKKIARPTGEWIDEGEQCGEHWFKCSVCDTSTIVPTTWDSTRWNIPLYNYCPYCGADMRGEQNDKTN